MKKTAAELKAGDIFECHGGRAVVLLARSIGTCMTVYSALLDRQPLPVAEPPAPYAYDAVFEVEANAPARCNVTVAQIERYIDKADNELGDECTEQWVAECRAILRAATGLTLAQQHAEELADLVRLVAATDPKGSMESTSICGRARSLVDKIDPVNPPTLPEALNTMRALIDTVLTGGDAREAATESERLLDRARRAGLI